MKSAVFALAGLVFALGMAGTLGYGYESYGYSGPTGFSGYGQKGQLETTQYIPYAVPVPSPVAAPAYGAVGGASTGGIFGDDSRKYNFFWSIRPRSSSEIIIHRN